MKNKHKIEENTLRNKRVILHLQDQDMKQKDMSILWGIPQSTLSGLMTNKRVITLELAKKICKFTGEDPEYLVGVDEEEYYFFDDEDNKPTERPKIFIDDSFLRVRR